MLINPAQIPEIGKAGYMDVKVSDFGISKILNATTTISPQTLMIGRTGWMVPEVMFESEEDSSKMKYPLKSDVYGYATMCYGTLWGRTPFQELCPSQLEEKVKAGLRPTLPKSPPTSLLSLIKYCWDADVGRRPSFSRISTELRHLKGIYMINGKYSCK
jgi:serine/threonine protein kinase